MDGLCDAVARFICSGAHPLDSPCLLPLCARCTGLYLGMAFSLGSWRPRRRRPALARALWAALLVLAAPIHVLATGEAASALGRFSSGAVSGAGIAILLGASPWGSPLAAAVLTVLAASRLEAAFLFFRWLTWPAWAVSWTAPVVLLILSLRWPGAPREN